MRTRFVAGRDGTLRFTPPGVADLGTITSATVTIKQSTGVDLPTPVVNQVATVAGVELSIALPAAQLVAPLARGVCPNGKPVAEAVYRLGRLTASYIHFYLPSNPRAAAELLLP